MQNSSIPPQIKHDTTIVVANSWKLRGNRGEGERVASGGHQYRAVSVIEDYWLLSVMCYMGHFSLAGKVNN